MKIRSRRKRAVTSEPMRGIPLPEGRQMSTGTFTLKSHPRTIPTRVARTEHVFSPMSAIERRLMTAMKTIRSLPDHERRFFIVKGPSIPYLQEYMDAYASSDVKVAMFIPRPQDVSDCLTALSWVRHIPKNIWKIMWLRSFGFSFGLIGRYIGMSDETARRWYREGITDAWSAANGT